MSRTPPSSPPTHSNTGQNRHAAHRKPSLWRHVMLSMLACVTVVGGTLAAVHILGNPDDAQSEQTTALPTLPQADAGVGLNDDRVTDLPDLLGGAVGEDENPTTAMTDEQSGVDALGNPVNPGGSALAGGTDGASAPTTAALINANALIRAPIQALQKSSPFGKVPAISPDGRTARKVYARKASIAPGTKGVSIIMGGMGINAALTQRAITELPPDISLSFAAHAPNLQAQINAARAAGHEVLLELPMESVGFDASTAATDPSAKYALRASGSNIRVNNLRNLDWLMSRASGYFGVINYNGDVFLTRSDAVVPILGRLSANGLSFIHDGSITAPSLPALSSASRLPFAQAAMLIDETSDRLSIDGQLDALIVSAQSGGTPIGVGFSYPQTIDAVKAFTETLPQKQLSLVPASATLQGGPRE